MMKHTPYNSGFALIYIMLVIAAFFLAASLATSTIGIFSGKRMNRYTQSAHLRMLTMQCGENVLMQVRNNTALTVSSTTVNMQSGTCTYSVSGTAPNKVIDIVAVRSNLYKRLKITVTRINPYILATWTETQ